MWCAQAPLGRRLADSRHLLHHHSSTLILSNGSIMLSQNPFVVRRHSYSLQRSRATDGPLMDCSAH
jgi:hypothetical protein